jgi:hypothetical protein
MNLVAAKSAFTIVAGSMLLMMAAPAVAQDSAGSLTQGAQQMAGQLTGAQQSAANKAICSAIAGNYQNAASAGATALTDPKVLTSAATSFASGTNMSVASATGMLKTYMSQNGTSILTSCATGNAASGLTSQLPNAGAVPQVPKIPSY